MDELEAYLLAALGGKHAVHVPLVKERLREQCCSDVDTLKSCWEELKDELPGVPRKMIADQLQKEELDSFGIARHVDPLNWVRGSVFGVVMTCAGAIIGGLQNADASIANGGAVAGALDESVRFMWGWAWGPLFALAVLEVTAVWKLGPLFGWEMIQERSSSVSMREAMRSNMTNVAVVGALLLTVVWAMLQSDPPVSGFPGRFISQWYAGLLILSVTFLLIAVLTCVSALLYVEPLDNRAALQCVVRPAPFAARRTSPAAALSMPQPFDSLWHIRHPRRDTYTHTHTDRQAARGKYTYCRTAHFHLPLACRQQCAHPHACWQGDNFEYFGEPVAQTMFAMLNCIIATILWVFGTYGMGMGSLSVVFFCWACTRTAVNFLYLSQWKNPHLDRVEVQKRAAMGMELLSAAKVVVNGAEKRGIKVRPAAPGFEG
jgi:hypothetical protein